jgi:hypothetical protein
LTPEKIEKAKGLKRKATQNDKKRTPLKMSLIPDAFIIANFHADYSLSGQSATETLKNIIDIAISRAFNVSLMESDEAPKCNHGTRRLKEIDAKLNDHEKQLIKNVSEIYWNNDGDPIITWKCIHCPDDEPKKAHSEIFLTNYRAIIQQHLATEKHRKNEYINRFYPPHNPDETDRAFCYRSEEANITKDEETNHYKCLACLGSQTYDHKTKLFKHLSSPKHVIAVIEKRMKDGEFRTLKIEKRSGKVVARMKGADMPDNYTDWIDENVVKTKNDERTIYSCVLCHYNQQCKIENLDEDNMEQYRYSEKTKARHHFETNQRTICFHLKSEKHLLAEQIVAEPEILRRMNLNYGELRCPICGKWISTRHEVSSHLGCWVKKLEHENDKIDNSYDVSSS